MANTPSETNNTTVAVAVMSAQGTLGGSPEWRTQLVTAIPDPTVQTTGASHDTIGPDNQYEAEAVVSATAAPKLAMGAHGESIDTFLEGAARCVFSGPISLRTTATRPTSATSVHYVFPLGTALKVNDLIWVSGCAIAANNGLKVVSGVPSTTVIPTTPAPQAEAFTAVQNVTIEVCGFQFAAGDLTLTTSGSVTTIGATVKDLTQLGLVSGQPIFIGSDAAAGYAYATAADYGPAYLTSTPVAGSFTCAAMFGQTFVTDAGAGKTMRLHFGQQLRVSPKTAANYVERFYQIETGIENLGTVDATAWIYSENVGIDKFTLSAPAQALVTLAVDTKATDATKVLAQRTNASTPTVPVRTIPFSTANSDFTGTINLTSSGARLTGYINAVNLVIEDQATDNPAHGQQTSAFTSFGKVRVKAEVTAFLTEAGAIDAARANSEVNANWWMRNAEGAYAFFIPSARIGNGATSFAKNQVATIDLPTTANKDSSWSTSLIVSKMPGCPALPARV
jgi:hypothetical protein